MSSRTRTAPWLGATLATWIAFVALVPPSRGHVFQTNLYPDIELKRDHLAIELWVATFLFPPLEHIGFGDGEPRPEVGSPGVREKIESFFASACPMAFDGTVVAPQLERLEFMETEEGSHLGETLDFTMAKLFFRYPLEGEPRRVKIGWGLWFPDGEVEVEEMEEGEIVSHDPNVLDMLIFVHGEAHPIYMTKTEPEFTWHAPARVFGDAVPDLGPVPPPPEPTRLALGPALPVAGGCLFLLATARTRLPKLARPGVVAAAAAAAILARGTVEVEIGTAPGGAPELTEAQAKDEFLRLHRGIYRAFEADGEDAIYNILAQSVDDAMLDRLYEEVYQSLIMREEGGAMSRVSGIDYIETEISPIPGERGFEIDCSWRVDGTVSHWGHSHRRSNEYQAEYTLAPRDERWKIVSAVVNLQKRVKPRQPFEKQGDNDTES